MVQSRIGTLWLIGGGNMGGALLARWAQERVASHIVLVDPGSVEAPAGVRKVSAIAEAGGAPDLVVVAVKPHIAPDAIAPLAGRLKAGTPLISIMAGTLLATLAKLVPDAACVRAMPNTPTRIGKGATGLFAGELDDAARAQVETLFAATGSVHWLREESEFDALTAVSGSGPAYVFRLVEAMAAAGEGAGLAPELAEALARETVIGAGALLEHDPRSATELRRAVTSPGGTTEAGLEALDDDPGLPALARAAIRAAAQRSRELAAGE